MLYCNNFSYNKLYYNFIIFMGILVIKIYEHFFVGLLLFFISGNIIAAEADGTHIFIPNPLMQTLSTTDQNILKDPQKLIKFFTQMQKSCEESEIRIRRNSEEIQTLIRNNDITNDRLGQLETQFKQMTKERDDLKKQCDIFQQQQQAFNEKTEQRINKIESYFNQRSGAINIHSPYGHTLMKAAAITLIAGLVIYNKNKFSSCLEYSKEYCSSAIHYILDSLQGENISLTMTNSTIGNITVDNGSFISINSDIPIFLPATVGVMALTYLWLKNMD